MEYIENKEVEEKEVKGIFTDMIKYAPSKLCGMLGNMITVPIYTGLFSQEQYGLYTISIAMLSFLCIIFSDWVGMSGLRFFRHHQLMDDLPKYVTTLVTILTINILLMFGLCMLFKDGLYSLFHVPFKYYLGVLVLIIPVAIRALLSQILRAQLKPVSYTITTILNQFATILLAIYLAKYMHLGAASILLSMGISITLIDMLLLYQSEILKVFRPQRIEWSSILPIMKYGVPIAVTSLSAWIITQSNKFIMNSISGFSKAALVGAGYGLTMSILLTLFAMITVAAVPRIINMYEAKIDVRPIISRFMGYYLLVSLPVIIVISIYNVDYTHLFISNPKMYEASVLVPYFSFGVFFIALADYTTLQYHLANKTHIGLIIKLISGIIGVVLNIVLIPEMGLVGVGIATLLTNFLYWFLSIVIVIKGLSVKIPKRMMLRLAATFVPSGILLWLLKSFVPIPGVIQMVIILGFFYGFYYLCVRRLINFQE